MHTWPSIRREAALALSPHDMAAGIQQLDNLIKSAARSIRKRDALFTFAKTLAAVVLILSFFAYFLNAYWKPPSPFASNVTIATSASSATMLMILWRAWTVIQHGGMAQRFGQLAETRLSEKLQQLIDSFASGVRDVRTASGATVRASLFASRWAIMLFSEEESERRWVRSLSGAQLEQEIFVRPNLPEHLHLAEAVVPIRNYARSVAFPDSHDPAIEIPLRNHDPEMRWLIGGTLMAFAAGLDRFLETLPPHQVDAYRAIITAGRRELRRGGQPGAQEAAIRIILADLAERKLLIRGTSRATIMKLLHGTHRGADIRRYFG